MFGLILLALLAGFGLGFLRGGSLSQLSKVRLRYSWIVPLALAVHIVLARPAIQRSLGVSQWGDWLYPLGDAVLVVFIILNLRLSGAWLPAVGLGANVLVKWLNGGKMPVDAQFAALLNSQREAQDALSAQGIWLHTVYIDATTRLPFLGDVVYLAPPYPWPNLLSPGDLILVLGVLLMIQGAMLANRRQKAPELA